MVRSYSELVELPTFEDRFRYLTLDGVPGRPTFGHERWMNQRFYHSAEWRSVRDYVIARDGGFDLGCSDHPIGGKILIHHIVPLTPETIEMSELGLLDPNNLISCSLRTHNAIHFGDETQVKTFEERRPNDTCPWKE